MTPRDLFNPPPQAGELRVAGQNVPALRRVYTGSCVFYSAHKDPVQMENRLLKWKPVYGLSVNEIGAA